jgi:hypothetical protein
VSLSVEVPAGAGSGVSPRSAAAGVLPIGQCVAPELSAYDLYDTWHSEMYKNVLHTQIVQGCWHENSLW